jgi:hypothetical protein
MPVRLFPAWDSGREPDGLGYPRARKLGSSSLTCPPSVPVPAQCRVGPSGDTVVLERSMTAQRPMNCWRAERSGAEPRVDGLLGAWYWNSEARHTH